MTPDETTRLESLLTRWFATLPNEIQRLEKLMDSVSWLLKLSASNADQRLQLASEIVALKQTLERVGDSLVRVIQSLSEIYEQREHVRHGLEHVRHGLEALTGEQRGAFATLTQQIEQTVSAVVALGGIKPPADKPTPAAAESPETAFDAHRTSGQLRALEARDPWYARLGFAFFRDFFRAGARSQFLFAVVIFLLCLVLALGVALRQHVNERQGAPLEQARGHQAPPPPQ